MKKQLHIYPSKPTVKRNMDFAMTFNTDFVSERTYVCGLYVILLVLTQPIISQSTASCSNTEVVWFKQGVGKRQKS